MSPEQFISGLAAYVDLLLDALRLDEVEAILEKYGALISGIHELEMESGHE